MIDDLRLDQELDRPGPKGRIQHVEQGLTARVAGDLGPEGSLLLGVSLGSTAKQPKQMFRRQGSCFAAGPLGTEELL